MLTVRDALNLPAFANARLVAGGAGLSQEIQWVHIVDSAQAQYEWARKGVLLLTTGTGLSQQPQLQETLVPKLAQEGFCGIVLQVGYGFEQVPKIMQQQANRLGLPIIEAPRDLLFIQITEEILKRIVSQQYDLQQQAAQFNQKLTQLVLQGAGLSELIQTLATLLHRSIIIESSQFEILAAAQRGEVDEARAYCVAAGQTKEELVEQLSQIGVYTQLQQTLKPLQIPPMPELGMSMARIVTPIVVQREVHGYIWIIAGHEPLTPLDELALNHAAMVAALILFKEQSVRQAAIALQGDFFTRLLSGEAGSVALQEVAQQIHYRLDHAHQVWIIRGPEVLDINHLPLETPIRQWLEREQSQPFLLFSRDRHWIAVVECQTADQGYQAAVAMSDALAKATPTVVGVGHVSPPDSTGEMTLQRSYEQAQEALNIAIALGQQQGASAFHKLGVLHWLYSLSPADRAANIYLAHLETVRAYDRKRNGDLLLTLESYLDHGSSLAETAAALHVHRNTLLHRLERIESLCEVNLKDAMERLNFHVALKSDRLHRV